MNVVELIEIALANVDRRHVEVTAMEPAEFATEAVAGLAELVFELTGLAIAPSVPGEKVGVGGSFDGETYLISVSGTGVGISDDAAGVLNRMLEDPELNLGIASVARLAARHGVVVRVIPDASGTAARVTVPSDLVKRVENGDQLLVDLTSHAALEEAAEDEFVPHEFAPSAGIGRVYALSESAWRESEAFLEKVFAPLRRGSMASGLEAPWPVERESQGMATVLRVRVPGESFLVTDDDSPSTAAAEAAVDIRSALSTFDEGRRSARESADRGSE